MTENENMAQTQVDQRDDALFETLDKNKRKKKRRVTILLVSLLLVPVILAVAGVFLLQQQVQNTFAEETGAVLSAAVVVGTINAVVTGTGPMTEIDLEAITVPEGVQIDQVQVLPNQTVEPGDILATVDMTSVINTLADLQAQVRTLDAQISRSEGESADTALRAGVSGRVKAVYGKAGDYVTDVMVSNGAVALLSLDGYMAATVRSGTLSAGDRVKVVLSDETELPGTVESVSGSYATVLVTDKGTKYGDRVKVYNAEGGEVGPGTLKVHTPLRVIGYAGTIASVQVAVEDMVSENTPIFTLKNTDYNASYHSLLQQREALEQTVMQLLAIQRDGAILATYPGGVYTVDHSAENPNAVVTLSADDRMCVRIPVSESDILFLSFAQRAAVNVPAIGEGYYTGIVTDISRSADEDGNFSAVVELDKQKGMLPGMSANVSIRISGEEGTLMVPVEAVHKTRRGAYVYTSYDPETEEFGDRRMVVAGLENSTYIEILSGIGIGDTVYYTKEVPADPTATTTGGNMQLPDFGSFRG